MTNTKSVVFPHKPAVRVARLPILLSCRIRLDEDQRNTLKKAYREYKDEHIPGAPPAVGGSGITTVTAQQSPSLIQGWSDLVLSDLITTRETIPLNTVILVQRALNVEVINPNDILNACQGYCDYVFAPVAE